MTFCDPLYANIWSQTNKLAEQLRKLHNEALHGLYSPCDIYSGSSDESQLWKQIPG